ncbi:MAG: hypothetical protein ACTSU6_03995 [Candidatus Njordarchaeales archaeon]
MFVSRAGRTVYFDLDDTLLEWYSCDKDDILAVEVVNNGHTFYKRAITANIESLKEHSHAGHIVVIWSKGGVEWANTAIMALNLEDYIDIVLTKPDWYYDDIDVAHWLPERQFKGNK